MSWLTSGDAQAPVLTGKQAAPPPADSYTHPTLAHES